MLTCTYEGVMYQNYHKHGCRVVINNDCITYDIRYCYSMVAGLTDDIAQFQLAEGFVYIMKNYIDRAKGSETKQLKELFEVYNYPLLDFTPIFSLASGTQINIDLGDRNDFLAFIEQLKREDALPVMPTESKLLQFLNGGESAYD